MIHHRPFIAQNIDRRRHASGNFRRHTGFCQHHFGDFDNGLIIRHLIFKLGGVIGNTLHNPHQHTIE